MAAVFPHTISSHRGLGPPCFISLYQWRLFVQTQGNMRGRPIVKYYDRVARSLPTVVVDLLVIIVLLVEVSRIQKLKAQVTRWEMAGDDHEVPLGSPNDVAMYEDDNKALLGGVVDRHLLKRCRRGVTFRRTML